MATSRFASVSNLVITTSKKRTPDDSSLKAIAITADDVIEGPTSSTMGRGVPADHKEDTVKDVSVSKNHEKDAVKDLTVPKNQYQNNSEDRDHNNNSSTKEDAITSSSSNNKEERPMAIRMPQIPAGEASPNNLAKRIERARERCSAISSDIRGLSSRCDSLHQDLLLIRQRLADSSNGFSRPAPASNDVIKHLCSQSIPGAPPTRHDIPPTETHLPCQTQREMKDKIKSKVMSDDDASVVTSLQLLDRLEREVGAGLDRLLTLATSDDSETGLSSDSEAQSSVHDAQSSDKDAQSSVYDAHLSSDKDAQSPDVTLPDSEATSFVDGCYETVTAESTKKLKDDCCNRASSAESFDTLEAPNLDGCKTVAESNKKFDGPCNRASSVESFTPLESLDLGQRRGSVAESFHYIEIMESDMDTSVRVVSLFPDLLVSNVIGKLDYAVLEGASYPADYAAPKGASYPADCAVLQSANYLAEKGRYEDSAVDNSSRMNSLSSPDEGSYDLDGGLMDRVGHKTLPLSATWPRSGYRNRSTTPEMSSTAFSDFNTPAIQALTCLESVSGSGRLFKFMATPFGRDFVLAPPFSATPIDRSTPLIADVCAVKSSVIINTPPDSDYSGYGRASKKCYESYCHFLMSLRSSETDVVSEVEKGASTQKYLNASSEYDANDRQDNEEVNVRLDRKDSSIESRFEVEVPLMEDQHSHTESEEDWDEDEVFCSESSDDSVSWKQRYYQDEDSFTIDYTSDSSSLPPLIPPEVLRGYLLEMKECSDVSMNNNENMISPAAVQEYLSKDCSRGRNNNENTNTSINRTDKDSCRDNTETKEECSDRSRNNNEDMKNNNIIMSNKGSCSNNTETKDDNSDMSRNNNENSQTSNIKTDKGSCRDNTECTDHADPTNSITSAAYGRFEAKTAELAERLKQSLSALDRLRKNKSVVPQEMHQKDEECVPSFAKQTQAVWKPLPCPSQQPHNTASSSAEMRNDEHYMGRQFQERLRQKQAEELAAAAAKSSEKEGHAAAAPPQMGRHFEEILKQKVLSSHDNFTSDDNITSNNNKPVSNATSSGASATENSTVNHVQAPMNNPKADKPINDLASNQVDNPNIPANNNHASNKAVSNNPSSNYTSTSNPSNKDPANNSPVNNKHVSKNITAKKHHKKSKLARKVEKLQAMQRELFETLPGGQSSAKPDTETVLGNTSSVIVGGRQRKVTFEDPGDCRAKRIDEEKIEKTKIDQEKNGDNKKIKIDQGKDGDNKNKIGQKENGDIKQKVEGILKKDTGSKVEEIDHRYNADMKSAATVMQDAAVCMNQDSETVTKLDSNHAMKQVSVHATKQNPGHTKDFTRAQDSRSVTNEDPRPAVKQKPRQASTLSYSRLETRSCTLNHMRNSGSRSGSRSSRRRMVPDVNNNLRIINSRNRAAAASAVSNSDSSNGVGGLHSNGGDSGDVGEKRAVTINEIKERIRRATILASSVAKSTLQGKETFSLAERLVCGNENDCTPSVKENNGGSSDATYLTGLPRAQLSSIPEESCEDSADEVAKANRASRKVPQYNTVTQSQTPPCAQYNRDTRTNLSTVQEQKVDSVDVNCVKQVEENKPDNQAQESSFMEQSATVVLTSDKLVSVQKYCTALKASVSDDGKGISTCITTDNQFVASSCFSTNSGAVATAMNDNYGSARKFSLSGSEDNTPRSAAHRNALACSANSSSSSKNCSNSRKNAPSEGSDKIPSSISSVPYPSRSSQYTDSRTSMRSGSEFTLGQTCYSPCFSKYSVQFTSTPVSAIRKTSQSNANAYQQNDVKDDLSFVAMSEDDVHLFSLCSEIPAISSTILNFDNLDDDDDEVGMKVVSSEENKLEHSSEEKVVSSKASEEKRLEHGSGESKELAEKEVQNSANVSQKDPSSDREEEAQQKEHEQVVSREDVEGQSSENTEMERCGELKEQLSPSQSNEIDSCELLKEQLLPCQSISSTSHATPNPDATPSQHSRGEASRSVRSLDTSLRRSVLMKLTKEKSRRLVMDSFDPMDSDDDECDNGDDDENNSEGLITEAALDCQPTAVKKVMHATYFISSTPKVVKRTAEEDRGMMTKHEDTATTEAPPTSVAPPTTVAMLNYVTFTNADALLASVSSLAAQVTPTAEVAPNPKPRSKPLLPTPPFRRPPVQLPLPVGGVLPIRPAENTGWGFGVPTGFPFPVNQPMTFDVQGFRPMGVPSSGLHPMGVPGGVAPFRPCPCQWQVPHPQFSGSFGFTPCVCGVPVQYERPVVNALSRDWKKLQILTCNAQGIPYNGPAPRWNANAPGTMSCPYGQSQARSVTADSGNDHGVPDLVPQNSCRASILENACPRPLATRFPASRDRSTSISNSFFLKQSERAPAVGIVERAIVEQGPAAKTEHHSPAENHDFTNADLFCNEGTSKRSVSTCEDFYITGNYASSEKRGVFSLQGQGRESAMTRQRQ